MNTKSCGCFWACSYFRCHLNIRIKCGHCLIIEWRLSAVARYCRLVQSQQQVQLSRLIAVSPPHPPAHPIDSSCDGSDPIKITSAVQCLLHLHPVFANCFFTVIHWKLHDSDWFVMPVLRWTLYIVWGISLFDIHDVSMVVSTPFFIWLIVIIMTTNSVEMSPSWDFKETEGLLPYSKEPSTGPCSEPD
jgi:hypothetical protein